MAKIGLSLGILGAAVVGTLVTLMATLLPLGLLETSRLDLVPAIWNMYVALVFGCIGFSFVFSGSIVAPRPHRAVVGIVLTVIGIGLVLAMSGDDADNISRDWLFVCYLLASIVGALLALALNLKRPRHEPAA